MMQKGRSLQSPGFSCSGAFKRRSVSGSVCSINIKLAQVLEATRSSVLEFVLNGMESMVVVASSCAVVGSLWGRHNSRYSISYDKKDECSFVVVRNIQLFRVYGLLSRITIQPRSE